MERIEALIEKLKEQYKARADSHQLLATLQMLEKEITGIMKETQVLGTTGIAVYVPNAPVIRTSRETSQQEPVDDQKQIFHLVNYDIENQDEEMLHFELETLAKEEKEFLKPSLGTKADGQPQRKQVSQAKIIFEDDDMGFDALNEVPTLSQQVKQGTASFKEKATEDVAAQLKKILKIRDLRTAIKPNERKLFVAELFRGDEVMYERSIKTINNFHIFAEAEYWIKRELKTKLGWPASSPTVDFFELLVKKRFG